MTAYPRVKFISRQSRGIGYLDGLILCHQREVKVAEVIPEEVPIWRPIIRVSSTVVKRKGRRGGERE